MHLHKQPDKQKTWGVKSKKGYYVGTSLKHYCYYNGYLPERRAIRGTDTATFKHKYITSPTIMPADAIVHATKKLSAALRGNTLPPLAKNAKEHIDKLTNIFAQTHEAYSKRQEQPAANLQQDTHHKQAKPGQSTEEGPKKPQHDARVAPDNPRLVVALEIVVSSPAPLIDDEPPQPQLPPISLPRRIPKMAQPTTQERTSSTAKHIIIASPTRSCCRVSRYRATASPLAKLLPVNIPWRCCVS